METPGHPARQPGYEYAPTPKTLPEALVAPFRQTPQQRERSRLGARVFFVRRPFRGDLRGFMANILRSCNSSPAIDLSSHAVSIGHKDVVLTSFRNRPPGKAGD